MTLEIVLMIVLLIACSTHVATCYNKKKKLNKYFNVIAFVFDVIALGLSLVVNRIFLTIVISISIGIDLSALVVKKMKSNVESTVKEPIVLKSASERYKETANPQFCNYIEKIANSAKCGNEDCYLLTDNNSSIRKEHVNLLTAQGYDIHISRNKDVLNPEKFSYFVQCYWNKNASGKVTANFDWENEL